MFIIGLEWRQNTKYSSYLEARGWGRGNDSAGRLIQRGNYSENKGERLSPSVGNWSRGLIRPLEATGNGIISRRMLGRKSAVRMEC